jgi:hypothetical protein
MKKHFFKNYDKLLEIVEKNMDKNGPVYVRIYSMSTQIDYNCLKNKLTLTKELINIVEK